MKRSRITKNRIPEQDDQTGIYDCLVRKKVDLKVNNRISASDSIVLYGLITFPEMPKEGTDPESRMTIIAAGTIVLAEQKPVPAMTAAALYHSKDGKLRERSSSLKKGPSAMKPFVGTENGRTSLLLAGCP